MPRSFDASSDSDTLLGHGHNSPERLSVEKPLAKFPPKRRWRCAVVTTPVILHLCLAALYTTLFFAFWDYQAWKPSGRHKSGLLAYSPAWEAIKWEPRLFESEIEASNPFKGLPRPELDEAWNKLLGPTAVRVSKEDLDRINRTSVPLLDGSGYMAGLDVYHQLHCLRYVRRYLHKDYYNMTEEKNLGQHIDHCLDSLRKYIMCNADVVIQTFDWIPNFHRPWPNFRIVHECANWEAIEEWAWAHHFDGFDETLLKHPNFHPELPDPFDYSVSGNDV
ncbi:GTP:AMP phosphotransferase, mitochondrial [Purpureocillium lavendulum]|uniref:GTP:AMP phosphotransferase, mitochondrial n=1 Tax=Purpureocillium lavendulum TaxID=1247861 RepID=A0AB34FTL6_9HYPO|nr:GTP:AMP phosphotransferase, mitochondrial [Purpureocillium lavendulum]